MCGQGSGSVGTCLNDSPFTRHPVITGFGLRSRLGRKAAIEESESSSTTPTTAAGEGKQFTWQEVAEHNSAKSVWVTVRGKVYDITGAFFMTLVEQAGSLRIKRERNVCVCSRIHAHGNEQASWTTTRGGRRSCCWPPGGTSPTPSTPTTPSPRSPSRVCAVTCSRVSRSCGQKNVHTHHAHPPLSTHHTKPVLNKFEIGRVSNYEFPRYKEDDRGFYRALCQRVGAYFKENDLNPKVLFTQTNARIWWGVWKGGWCLYVPFQ